MDNSVNFNRAANAITNLFIKNKKDMLEEPNYDFSVEQVNKLEKVRLVLRRLYNSLLFRVLSYFLAIGISLVWVSFVEHKKLDLVLAPMFAGFMTFVTHKFMFYAMDRGNLLPLAILTASAILGLVFVQYDLYCKMAGMVVAFLPAFHLEKKYVNMDDRTVWWKQLLKILIGITIVLIVKQGLKILLPETLILDFLKYLLIGVFIAVVIPWLFIKRNLKRQDGKEGEKNYNKIFANQIA